MALHYSLTVTPKSSTLKPHKEVRVTCLGHVPFHSDSTQTVDSIRAFHKAATSPLTFFFLANKPGFPIQTRHIWVGGGTVVFSFGISGLAQQHRKRNCVRVCGIKNTALAQMRTEVKNSCSLLSLIRVALKKHMAPFVVSVLYKMAVVHF